MKTPRRFSILAADSCGTFARCAAGSVGEALVTAAKLARTHRDAAIWVQDDLNADIGFDGLSEYERDLFEFNIAKVRRAA